MRRLLTATLFSVSFALSSLAASSAWAVTKVPPGNRSATQPNVPTASKSRTQATNSTFQAKYKKIRDLIASDKKLQGKIKKTARQYGIAPIHIVGALVGEHTYNVDAVDRLQELYLKAVAYLNEDIRFAHGKETVAKFVKRPEFSRCSTARDSYDLWSCRETIWKAKFQGKTVDGVQWPNDRFSRVFFQPFYAGQTFGLGQINPLTALRVTDVVNKVSKKPKLSINKPNKVYEAIIDPDTTLVYMAAVIKVSIDAYRTIGGFDISNNPGITATLYNLGNVRSRAGTARARGSMPRENYYGWLVNDKREELEAILR
ncbi:MAG: DUF1402 family protein [Rhizobiaceae bacterium]|nr:DUF1402 family protein [Rhizobiaceae bacterium]